MNRAQGNTRQKPDGFLHIQNFTVTKASNIEGVVWQLMSKEQKELVELVLIERTQTCDAVKYLGQTAHHFKHGNWRFSRRFLEGNFRIAVRRVLEACNVTGPELFESRWFK